MLLTVVLTACGVGGPGDDNDDAAVQDAQTQNDSTVNQDGTAGQDAQQDGQVTGVQTMTTEEFYNDHLDTWFDRGGHVVDMRADTDWAAAHIPDAVNLPLDLAWDNGAFTNYGSSTLSALVRVQDLPLAFYGLAADEATIMEVAQAALDMGYNNVWVIQGGIEAWRAAHHYEDIEMGVLYSDHYDPIPADEFLIDADHAETYDASHIAGALLFDAQDVWDATEGALIDDGQALLYLLGRDLAGQLDSKMAALGHLIHDAARAAAAYVARRRFGYRAKAVADALGYGDASGVSHAIRRIESGNDALHKTIARIERSLD